MEQNFDNWNHLKKELNTRELSHIYFKEWDIWWTSFGQNIGKESFWKWEKFRRPVLVFKKFSSDLFLSIPLSTKEKTWSWFCEIDLQWQKRTALLYQLKLLDKKRLWEKIWQLDEKDFENIKKRLSILLNL